MPNARIILIQPCCGQDSWLAIARRDDQVLATSSGVSREATLNALKGRLAQVQPSLLAEQYSVSEL